MLKPSFCASLCGQIKFTQNLVLLTNKLPEIKVNVSRTNFKLVVK